MFLGCLLSHLIKYFFFFYHRCNIMIQMFYLYWVAIALTLYACKVHSIFLALHSFTRFIFIHLCRCCDSLISCNIFLRHSYFGEDQPHEATVCLRLHKKKCVRQIQTSSCTVTCTSAAGYDSFIWYR